MLVGAAERLQRREDAHSRKLEDWMALVEDTRDRLLRGPFEALPLDGFIRQDDPKGRVLTVARPGDRLVEEALRPVLQRALAPRFRASVHGYRAGRSTFSAAAALSKALAEGFVELAMLDVADFYGSIDHARLRRMLDGVVAPDVADVLMALVRAPVRVHGRTVACTQGVPLGRSIAPPLANLYLLDLDAAVEREDVGEARFLRYADDLLVAAKTPEARERGVARIEAAVAALGLTLKDAKTERLRYDGAPVVYLGHAVTAAHVWQKVDDARLQRIVEGSARAVDERKAALPEANEVAQPNRRDQTLYVTEPGLSLRVAQGMIAVKRREETVREVALHRVDRVMVLANVSFSSAFMAECIEARIPVLFYVGKGAAFGTLVSGAMPNPLRLRAQYDLLRVPERRLALARQVVEAKLRAMSRRLVGLDGADGLRERIAAAMIALTVAEDIPQVRGVEGDATRAYFEGFARRIKKPEFAFTERTKRPPRDPINSLLSFAYSMLFSEMQVALLVHGLDPHAGVLHELARDHPALASDLMEPYRALVGDSFVLTLVNGGQVQAKGFQKQSDGGVYMNHDTRRDVIRAFEAFLRRPAGGAKGAGSPRRLIHAAARAMLRVVLGDADTLHLPLIDHDVEEDEHTREEVTV